MKMHRQPMNGDTAPATPPQVKRSGAGRQVLGLLVGLGISLAALAGMGTQLGALPTSLHLLPMLFALSCLPVGWLLHGLMFRALLRPQQRHIPLRDLVLAHLKLSVVGAITPFGGGEIPYAVYLLHQLDIPSDVAASVIITKGVVNILVLAIGAALALALTPAVFQLNLPLLLVSAAVLAACGLGLKALSRHKMPPSTATQGTWRTRLQAFIVHLHHGIVDLWRSHPLVVLSCAGLTVLAWAATLLIGPLTLMALGWHGNWWSIIAAQLALYTLLPLAPTPGSSGAAELGYAAVLATFVPAAAIASSVLLWRVMTYYLPLATGALLLGLRRQVPVAAA